MKIERNIVVTFSTEEFRLIKEAVDYYTDEVINPKLEMDPDDNRIEWLGTIYFAEQYEKLRRKFKQEKKVTIEKQEMFG